jgi:hypothetical protein
MNTPLMHFQMQAAYCRGCNSWVSDGQWIFYAGRYKWRCHECLAKNMEAWLATVPRGTTGGAQ